MNNMSFGKRGLVAALGLSLLASSAFADHGGHVAHFSGGAHFAGGTHFNHGVGIARAGYGGYGYRGGYGFHGGYGYHGGYYGGGFRPWPLLGLGIFVATLPLYWATQWWDGVPYYYANDTYYLWNRDARQYEVVAPPASQTADTATPGAPADSANSADLFVYPKNGQSAEQMARDRYECHRWAADQTGFDPSQTAGGVSAQSAAAKREDYVRAQGACLDARGYSTR
jgi:hypothetical protein